MKLTINAEKGTNTTDMLIGQIAEIVEFSGWSNKSGQHVLRTYSGFVLLEDPSVTWGPQLSGVVRILPPGTKITLETEN